MACAAEAGHGWLSRTNITRPVSRFHKRAAISSPIVKTIADIEGYAKFALNVVPGFSWPEVKLVSPTTRGLILAMKCAGSEQGFEPAELAAGTSKPSNSPRKKLQFFDLSDDSPPKRILSTVKGRYAGASIGNVSTKYKAGLYQKGSSGKLRSSSRVQGQTYFSPSGVSEVADPSLLGLTEARFWSILNDCLKQRNWRVALDVFAAMKKSEAYKANVRAYSLMIRIMAKAKHPHRAFQLFEEIQAVGLQPDIYVFTGLLDAYGRSGMLEKAVSVFQKMKETPACKPNVFTYGCMMAAYGRASQWEKIDLLFCEMRDLGLKQLSSTFNVVIGAYGRGGQWGKMEGALDAMVASGCIPDTFTYNTMIDAYGKGSQYQSMERTLEQMRAAGCPADILTYSSLIDAYRKASRHEKMEEILEHMRVSGCKPDVKAFSLLIDIYGKRGMFEKMEATLQEMQAAGCQGNIVTYTGIIDAYGKAGRYEEMERVWERMKEQRLQPDYSAFVATISAYGRGGLYDKMEARFQELQDAAKDMRLSGAKLGTAAFNAIIDAYGKGKLIDNMESAFGLMQSTGHQPDVITYSALINAYGKAGLLAKMDSTYVLMQVMGVAPNEHTFSALIDGYGKKGLVEKAEAALRDMLKAGFSMNLVAYTSIIDAYGSAKMFKGMASRFNALKVTGMEASCQTIGVLLTALCSCRSHEEISGLLSCIRSCKDFSIIARLLEERVDKEGETSLWLEAAVLFDGLQSEGTAPRLVLYDALVEALWCFGWRGRAWQVLIAGRERDVFPQARVVADEELLLDLHLLSVNVAQVMLIAWLSEMESTCIKEETPYEQVTVITGWGKRSRVEGDSPLKSAVTARLASMHSPFRILRENAGRFVAPVNQVCRWLSMERLASHLSLEDVAEPGPDHLLSRII